MLSCQLKEKIKNLPAKSANFEKSTSPMLQKIILPLLVLVGLAFSMPLQQTVSVFQNTKYRILNYGEFSETSTASPTVITLNLESNTIDISTESSQISGFFGNITSQAIRSSQKQGARQWIYFTQEGYIFRIQPAQRQILVTKEGTNIRMHALYLDEVTFN